METSFSLLTSFLINVVRITLLRFDNYIKVYAEWSEIRSQTLSQIWSDKSEVYTLIRV